MAEYPFHNFFSKYNEPKAVAAISALGKMQFMCTIYKHLLPTSTTNIRSIMMFRKTIVIYSEHYMKSMNIFWKILKAFRWLAFGENTW
jgi:hypothetical protein